MSEQLWRDANDAIPVAGRTTNRDLERFAELAGDLLDEQLMASAWSLND